MWHWVKRCYIHGNEGKCLSLNATVWLIKVFFIVNLKKNESSLALDTH